MSIVHKRDGKLEWVPLSKLPKLTGARLVALDLETYDPELLTHGPGGVRGVGHICGLSFATDTGESGYIPVSHPESKNWRWDSVRSWLKRVIGDGSKVRVVGANILYDLDWLRAYGFELVRSFDVQYAEPLLNENLRSYSLDSLGKRYLPKKYHKAGDHLSDVVQQVLGVRKGPAASHLWELPAEHVGAYAEMDAITTLKVFQAQEPLLEEQGLADLFEMECGLIPLLLDMRWRGVAVDERKVEAARRALSSSIRKNQGVLDRLAGKKVNAKSTADLVPLYEGSGVPIPVTAKGNPSITADWLGNQGDAVSEAVSSIRRDRTTISTFLEGQFGLASNGRIHCQFHPLKSDAGGTVTGRFSSSKPNLQQVPSSEKKNAALIRSLFVPDDGQFWWQIDWSQIEYRMMVHYACVTRQPGVERARDAYRNDPTTDFHQMCADLVSVSRKEAKTVNFGIAYGMGVSSLARALNVSKLEAEGFLDEYKREAPWLQALSRDVMRVARKRGHIRTILGRRRRFPLFEPLARFNERVTPLPFDEAKKTWGPRIQRAFVYASLNSLIQGGCADLMKKAMLDAYRAGLFADDALGTPLLTVHDELDGSSPRGARSHEALLDLKNLMETCLPLAVPIQSDLAVGKDWWNLKDVSQEGGGPLTRAESLKMMGKMKGAA